MLPKGKKGLSRLSVFCRKAKTRYFRNKFYSKAQCFRADFSKSSFVNVNFKGAILTGCNFKDSTFTQVEFLGTNLKKSNFTGSVFKYCVFSRVLMKNSNFRDCTFEECIFVSTNVVVAKNVVIGKRNRIFKQQPSPEVSQEILTLLDGFRFNSKVQNSRVLHLKGGKINTLTLQSLVERLGEKRLKRGLLALDGNLPYRIITANGLCNAIDRAAG
ncbi:pentapeptide repeat-containing protein [Marinobacter persicus]|uniref:Pentapeptide repeat protein n=1 Tax=Marinobacter persicus TaxID=930118 RepID=A0A2S6G1M9_9GAMM|nr:pentapeptide repeat-containing protein [Marinobacter persicus]PPK48239.1 pentapeptide repeat protein [Marinobacter persicus]PPK50001.1 pentapeptide repeat protein [Marinobacter persicus]PPK54204.1 pentapeptide repeat protein [Marinobacter persicus]